MAPGEKPDELWGQGDSGASDPGSSAAAGEEEDRRGRRGHLLHVQGSIHYTGALTSHTHSMLSTLHRCADISHTFKHRHRGHTILKSLSNSLDVVGMGSQAGLMRF